MTELHLDPAALHAYGSRTATVDDAAEAHVLRCSTCRAGLADTVDGPDLERSWAALADRVGLELPAGGTETRPQEVHESTSPAAGFDLRSTEAVPEDAGGAEIQRRRRRHALVAAAAVLVAVVIVVSTTGESADWVASSGGPGWVDILPSDSAVLDGAPPLAHVLAVTAWKDDLVVVTASAGAPGTTAWVLEGDDWTRRAFNPPEGCDPNGGIASISDRLVLSCSGPDRGVFVTSTTDLADWDTHVVADTGGSFGTAIGPSPAGGLTVSLLEGVDQGYTTQGATLRVWTSTDLEAWTEIPGADDDQLLDVGPQRIRSFGNTVVVTGAHTVYPDDTGNDATYRPALWVSRAGSAFTRIDVAGDGAAVNTDGWIIDVATTATGYVAVGGTGTGSRPLAWTSTDLETWMPASFTDDVTGSGMLWSLAQEPGGRLLAVAFKQAGTGSLTWSSTDGGATWRVVGEGPDLLARHGKHVVGARAGDRLRVQRWDGTVDASTASESEEEDALVLDVGSLEDLADAPDQVLVVPSEGTRHQIFVVRDGTGISAFSARSPKQGCRLVFAADVVAENPDFRFLGRNAFFHDPCHGAVFDRTGNHAGGPSPRDLYRYDVEERNGRILVDTGLLRPGPWSTGIDQEDPPLDKRGETDRVAERWRDIVEDVDGRRATDPTLPAVLVLGAFHDPASGLVTVPFTYAGTVAHLYVGPAAVHPPDTHPDDPPVETERVAEGVEVVESGPAAALDEIRLVNDLADGLRLRIELRWGFEDDPVPDLVSFIDHVARSAT